MSESEITETQKVEKARILKERADIKKNLLDAVGEKDVTKAIESLRVIRRYLLQLDKTYKRGTVEWEKEDSHFVSDGFWAGLLIDFFKQVKKYEDNGEIPDLRVRDYVYLDGVNRMWIKVKKGKPVVEIAAGTISAPDVVDRWKGIEQSYEMYYGRLSFLINPEVRARVESGS